MSWNSTHTAIAAGSTIAITAMITSTPLAEVAPIIAAIGAYAGIREYKRIKSE